MERVTGIGGIFFKSNAPDGLKEWYRQHLGITSTDDRGMIFEWRELEPPQSRAFTVWAPFPHDTDYFEPSTAPYMINYRVANLDRMLEQLRDAGVQVDDRVEEYSYGRFAWARDPEGNRFELWEPPAEG